MEGTSIKAVRIEKDDYFLVVHEGSKEFECLGLPMSMILTDYRDQYYTSVLNEADIVGACVGCKMDLCQYCVHLKEALKETANEDAYSFSVEKDNLKLVVKRKLDGSRIKVRLISLAIEIATANVLGTLLTQVTDQLHEQKKHLGELEEERRRLKELYAEAKASLTSFVSTKDQWEKELYSKFVVVLNEKKSAIESCRTAASLTDADEGGTDGEDGGVDNAKPSTSRSSDKHDDSDDLTFEDTDRLIVTVPRPRKRTTAQSKRAEPSKPAASKRKTTRRAASPASNLDADDLLNEL